MRSRIELIPLVCLFLLLSQRGSAELSSGILNDPTTSKAIISTIGTWTNHRSFRGASSIGLSTTIAIEASAVHLSDSFFSALGSVSGSSSAASGMRALPSAKLVFQQGFTKKFDFSASGLWYKDTYIIGGDVKYTFYEPPEGITFAFDFGYTTAWIDSASAGSSGTFPVEIDDTVVGNGSIAVRATTLSAYFLASRSLGFADPYLGLGFEWTIGQVNIPVTFSGGSQQTLTSDSFRATNLAAIVGVSFRFTPFPMVLALGGGYSGQDRHYFGLVIGTGL